MKVKLFVSFAALCVGALAWSASAAPKYQTKRTNDAKNAGDSKTAKPGCAAHKAQAAADKPKAAKKGCCGKKAKTASGKPGCGKKNCHMKGKLTASKDGTGCPIEAKIDAILAGLPAVKYIVGDQTMCCGEAAKYHAEKTKKPLTYKVGDQPFTDESKALARLASVLEHEVESLKSVQYSVGGKCSACPMTAKSMAKKSGKKMMYRVAGWDFAEKVEADKAAKAAIAAAEKVKMTYKVGDKTFPCPKSAGAKCKKSGSKMTYVVGEEETCCKTEAKILLEQARVAAMIRAASSLL